tara:strand:+ start:459 stop:752 length:294 start_codon:yes stop_codon:yes gene_type:complete
MGKKSLSLSNNKKQRKNQTGLKSKGFIHYDMGCCCGWRCSSRDDRHRKILWRLHNKMCKVEKDNDYTGVKYTTSRELNSVDKITRKVLKEKVVDGLI